MSDMPVTAVKNAKAVAEDQVLNILRILECSTGTHVDSVIVQHASKLAAEPGLCSVRINLSI